MNNSHLIHPDSDPSLDRAAELLAANGRQRDAILLVERAIREESSDGNVLLLAALLFGTRSSSDRRLAANHLQRLQIRAAEIARRVRQRD